MSTCTPFLHCNTSDLHWVWLYVFMYVLMYIFALKKLADNEIRLVRLMEVSQFLILLHLIL